MKICSKTCKRHQLHELQTAPVQVPGEDQAYHLLGRRAATEVHILHKFARYQFDEDRQELPQLMADLLFFKWLKQQLKIN